jgi:hypothetical protein
MLFKIVNSNKKTSSGACAYIGSQISSACKETHPHIALAGQVVQHAGTAAAAVAATKNWWEQRTGEKEEEKKKITEEKGKAKAEEPKKETKEQGTQTEAEKGTQTEEHKDLIHNDADGAPQQHIPQKPIEPVASGSGTKHEKPETKPEEKPLPPVPAAHKESTPAPTVRKQTLSVESHEMKPLVHKTKTG